jgi:spore coat polysaccharide biosynthesis protein SpsF (cytidylyltransferase family)
MSKGDLCRPSNFKNKVGGIIVARCTSSRLPNKALLEIQGRETIALVIDRMKRCESFDCLILATSTDPSDDALVEIAKREGILSFRGSLDNVSMRFYEAAELYNLDYFVRITGDSLLCDSVMLDVAVKSHLEAGRDVTFSENMPFGTNKEVISMNTIKTILDKANIPSNTEYLEYYLENDRYFSKNVVKADYDFDSSLRITLDYEEDLRFFDCIYTHFKDINPSFTLRDALAWLQKNPHVAEINKHMVQKYSSVDIDVTLDI